MSVKIVHRERKQKINEKTLEKKWTLEKIYHDLFSGDVFTQIYCIYTCIQTYVPHIYTHTYIQTAYYFVTNNIIRHMSKLSWTMDVKESFGVVAMECKKNISRCMSESK